MDTHVQKAEKKILKALRLLKQYATNGNGGQRGEEPPEENFSWGDALVQYGHGMFYASACIAVEKGMRDVLPVFSGDHFPVDYFEAPPAGKLKAIKKELEKKIEHGKKVLKNSERARMKEKIHDARARLKQNERTLLDIEVAARLSLEPGCIRSYVITTARDPDRKRALEKLRAQARTVSHRAGGKILWERDIRKCFKWEDAVSESVERFQEKTPGFGEFSGKAAAIKKMWGGF